MPKDKKRGAEDSSSKVEKKSKKQKLNGSEATPTTNGTTGTLDSIKKISTSVIPLPMPKKSTSTIPLPTARILSPTISIVSKPAEKTKSIDKTPTKNGSTPAKHIGKSNSPIPLPTVAITNGTSTPKATKEKPKDKQKEKKKEKSKDDKGSKKTQSKNEDAGDHATPKAVPQVAGPLKVVDQPVDKHQESKHKKKRKSKAARLEVVESQSQTLKDSQSTLRVETPKPKRTKNISSEETTAGAVQSISDLLQMPENPENTGLHLIEAEMYLQVNPIALSYSVDGAIADAVSPLLLTYYEPLKGYILSHQNGRATAGKDAVARCIDQYGPPFLWITIEVVVFRPIKGAWLTGSVNLQTPSHMNLMVYNYFSAKVEKKRLPSSWKFIEDEYEEPLDKHGSGSQHYYTNKKYRRTTGTYVDGQGTKIQGELVFRAIDFDITTTGVGNQSIISIDGTLLNEGDERSLLEKERQIKSTTMVNRPRQGGAAASSSRA